MLVYVKAHISSLARGLRASVQCYFVLQLDSVRWTGLSRPLPGEWRHANRYGSGACAEYSTGPAVHDSRWDANGYQDGGQHSFAAKDFAAHERWLANLRDVITSNGLDDLWENQQVPTREAVARQFTSKTSEEKRSADGPNYMSIVMHVMTKITM